MQQYDWLLSKLDAFIRKYYINQLIRGGLILLTCLILYILVVSVGEYYLYLPAALKITIVGLFALLGGAALIFWIILPLTRMAKLGNTLSHENAAGIVGKHFPEISDKLLNILQLKKQSGNEDSRELIEASIDQKAGQIVVVPITGAVDLSKNKRLLPYFLPVLLAGIFLLVAAPNVFRDASERLLQPTKTFEKPAPFSFNILTNPMIVVRNGDYVLKVQMKGSALPAELSVEMNGERIPMTALANNTFQYTFKNITEAVTFRLFGAGFYSQPYTLKVVQKPVLKAIKVHIDYPDYTGRKDEFRNSLGDMTLPVGTRVGWGFMTQYTDAATLRWASGGIVNLPNQAGLFGYQFQFMNDTAYTVSLRNQQSPVVDSYRYQVQVIPDQFPVIQLQQFRDTIAGKQIIITGTAGDDYAVSRVAFHYDITTEKGQHISGKSIPLKVAGGALTPFQQYIDINALNLQNGQKLSYFIEAWDNDGVHGPKASRSELMSYQMYTPNQLDSAMNVNAKQINSGLSNSAQQTKQLQQEFKEMQNKMLESGGEMSFEQKQNVQELMQRQEQLQKQVENTKKRFDEQKQQSEQKQYSEDVREKQEELKKQMDNLLNDELKKQMEKLQELMKKLNKENAMQTAQQLEQENKLFNMDLQRMQELMKQLEMQMRMEDLANKMDDLAKKQGDLKKETDNKKKDNQSLNAAQKDLKKELDKAMNEDMKELQKVSDEAKQKQDMQQSQDAGKQAQQDMQKSSEELEKNDNKQAGEEQKNAQQNLQAMADQLRKQSGGMDMKQIEIDIKATRQLLTNLIRLSFDQEKLMNSVRQTSTASQAFLTNQTEQGRLHGNSKMIKDSLFSLSKRIFKLAPTVNKETSELERNMKSATSSLEARMVGDALVKQQYVMTHTNNLALMLNEILSNLMQQQSQAQKQPGNGSCSKPGGLKPKPGPGKQLSDIITQQQQLSDKAGQQAKQQSKDGKEGKDGEKPGGDKGDKPGDKGEKPGGKKPGGKEAGGKESGGKGSGGQGEGQEGENEYGDAEQLAKLAAQQSAIRRQLQDMQNKLNGTGMGNSKELREIQQQMDKNETDLVNRRLTSEFMQRQKEIMTRLLEAEKSLREQEQDDKRSSNAGKEVSRPIPAELQQYLQNRQQLLELYRTVPPQLKPYYKSMVEQYFRTIGNK